MGSAKKIKPWYDKKNIITVIFLSISLSFTMFFFSPMDMFLSNQKEFYIDAVHVFVPLLLLAMLGSLVLILIGILSLKNKTAYNVVTSILCGLLLAFYIQMMFYNGRMDTARNAGRIFNDSYEEVNIYNLCNSLAMYLIIIMPLIMTAAREKYNISNTIINFTKGKVIAYLSALIFVMQFFGIIGTLAVNGIITANNSSIFCFAFEPIFSLSKDENITVFVIDSLDGAWMDTVINNNPEINDKLEGFTFYQNNIPKYCSTFPSVPHMLTNKEYRLEESRIEYLERIWQDETLFSKLNENNYSVNMVIDGTTTFRSFYDLSDYNNIVLLEKDDYKFNYLKKNGIIYTMVNLSFSKIVPYFWKNYFIYNINISPSEEFLIFNDDINDTVALTVSKTTDIKLNKYINMYGLDADSKQKNFSFIHLNGVHDIDSDISALNPLFNEDTDHSNTTTTICGQFETLFTYFDKMKELGVYDNSTIIIIADHGKNTFGRTSALLIKTKNADHIPLQFDAVSELSNENFFAGILEYAGIDHSEYGYSYNDIIEGEYHHKRYLTYSIANKVYDTLYEVTGDARDESNWKKISEGNE